jgi:hypothetical protein
MNCVRVVTGGCASTVVVFSTSPSLPRIQEAANLAAQVRNFLFQPIPFSTVHHFLIGELFFQAVHLTA